jgi:hypothetical protein
MSCSFGIFDDLIPMQLLESVSDHRIFRSCTTSPEMGISLWDMYALLYHCPYAAKRTADHSGGYPDKRISIYRHGPTPKKNSLPLSFRIIGPLILPIITFIGCQVLVLALGIWKCKQMGLVPIGTGLCVGRGLLEWLKSWCGISRSASKQNERK